MNQKALQHVSYFSSLPGMAMSFLLPLYCLDLGFSPFETTGLTAALSFALLASKLLVGNLCDTAGKKKVFCFGLLLKAVSYGLFAFSQSAVPLYIAQVLNGVAISLTSVSMYAIMSDNREGDFAVRRAKTSSAGGKGELLGVAICWLLLIFTNFSDGWKYLFLISGISAVYAALVAKNKLSETVAPRSSVQQRLPKKLLTLFTVNVFISVAITAVNVILVLYLSAKFTVTLEYLALVLLVPQIIVTYISPWLGRFIGKIKEKRAFYLGCVMAAIFLALIPSAQSLTIIAVYWTLYMVFTSVATLAFDSIVSINAGEQLRGKVSGTYLASSNLGSIIGSLIAGAAFQGVSAKAPIFPVRNGFHRLPIGDVNFASRQGNYYRQHSLRTSHIKFIRKGDVSPAYRVSQNQ